MAERFSISRRKGEMKVSRGRFAQYKILAADKRLRKHLIETFLFSKKSLATILDANNEQIVIKAAFGPEELKVYRENNVYYIQSSDDDLTVPNLEALYAALQKKLEQRYYILQKSPVAKKTFRYFLTMHRKTSQSKWNIASETKQSRTILDALVAKIYCKKIQQVVTLAAEKLGEVYPNCHTIVIEVGYDWRGRIWIYDTILHLPNSKWSQYYALRTERKLRNYLPHTDLLTHTTFNYFLERYKVIILKPCIGQHGVGVIQISKRSTSVYEIHSGMRKMLKPSLDEAFYYINQKYLSRKYYIVQQRIPLATISDCPMDVRVVTQKINGIWKVTGKLVKVAGNDFVITNAAQKLLTLNQSIQDAKILRIYLKPFDVRLDGICLQASKRLDENYAQLDIIGFDVGMTKIGALWIIEGNTVPDIGMFDSLEDKAMYKTIVNARNAEG